LLPGAKARDVFLAGARCLENGGLCASISDMGHGIGLDCHEKPFLTPYSDDTIRVGQTIVIEIYCEISQA
jgi:Xaa-Pro aminopeptidase